MHYFPAADANVCNCQWDRFFCLTFTDKIKLSCVQKPGTAHFRAYRWGLSVEGYSWKRTLALILGRARQAINSVYIEDSDDMVDA